MNLHRIEGRPEWAGIEPARMNAWQRVAARSGGIITIGNYFSLLGLLSVPFGLMLLLDGRLFAGILILGLGRLCDLLDGFLADKTGTKSPLGERIDAVFDKVSTGLLVMVLAAGLLVPLWVLILVVLPQVLMGMLAVRVWLKGSLLHPSLYGKWSMAAGWLALMAFVLVPAWSESVWIWGGGVAFLLLAVSMILSAAALKDYTIEYRRLVQTG